MTIGFAKGLKAPWWTTVDVEINGKTYPIDYHLRSMNRIEVRQPRTCVSQTFKQDSALTFDQNLRQAAAVVLHLDQAPASAPQSQVQSDDSLIQPL